MSVTFGKIRRGDQIVDRSSGTSQSLKRMIWTKVGQSTGSGEGATGRHLPHRVVGGVEQRQRIGVETTRRVDHANNGCGRFRDCRHTVGSEPKYDSVAARVVGH